MGWPEPHRGEWRGVYRDANGKRRKSTTTFRYKAQAREWAESQERAAKTGRDPDAGRILLKVWISRWETGRVVERTTQASDQGRIREIVDRFGDTPLEDLSPMAISTWCKQQSKDGRGPATVAKYHRLLSRILNDAVQERLITENVAKFVKVSLPTTHKETYLTRGQVDELMRLSESPVVIRTLAYTGRRWGEFAGLHKGDVDFLRGVMTVSQTVTEVSGKYMIKPYPKGRRPIQVPVPQHVLDALAGHMAQTPPIVCGLEREDGKPHRCSGLIFHTDRGKPLSRWVWPRTHLLPHLSAAGCPPETTTHDLRHTYASWLIQDGVSLRVVQKLLGHKSIVTTERYSHLEADTGLDAVRKALDTTSDPTDGESEGQSFA